MKIDIKEIINNPEDFSIHGETSNFPELAEIGCFGNITVRLSLISVGAKYLIEGAASGGLKYECSKCGVLLNGKFTVPVKIFIENSTQEGINWNEDQAQSFDDYVLTIGPRVREIPIISIIKEQIVLNCNPTFPGKNAQAEKCEDCKGSKFSSAKSKPDSEIDPRWEKLRTLLKRTES